MYYIIDGYNFIFRLSARKAKLQQLREETLRYLQTRFRALNIAGLIVFDGAHRRDEESGYAYAAPLEIAYAPKGQSADAFILEKLESASLPRQVTLITDDKGLTAQARALRAEVQTTRHFLHWLEKKRTPTRLFEPKETPQQIARLQKIFEERLREND